MPSMFLTVTTIKGPSKMHHGHHTCEAFVFVSYESFQKWARERSGEHSADYGALKEDLAWRMFQTLDVRREPGIAWRGGHHRIGFDGGQDDLEVPHLGTADAARAGTAYLSVG